MRRKIMQSIERMKNSVYLRAKIQMTTYKLRILPLFLLVIGLTTLTSSCKKKDMSLKLNKPHNIRGVVSYKRSFPDLNDAHLEVAKR